MLVGLRVQISPAGETELVSATVRVKPLTGATVIVEIAESPAFTVRLVGLAVIVKSTTLTVMVPVVWDRGPLVPVTVTVYVPAATALRLSVEVPEPVTLVGLRVAVKPVDGLAVSATTPLNPLRPVTVIVSVVVPPAFTARLDEAAGVLKYFIVAVT